MVAIVCAEPDRDVATRHIHSSPVGVVTDQLAWLTGRCCRVALALEYEGAEKPVVLGTQLYIDLLLADDQGRRRGVGVWRGQL